VDNHESAIHWLDGPWSLGDPTNEIGKEADTREHKALHCCALPADYSVSAHLVAS
jgi:hypothetical protein